MNDFSNKIIIWYNTNKRDLPWRNTKNPYFIWLSEVILQQTRVEQGLPYYIKFIEAFPSIEELAKAPQDEVLRLWQGLGYYSRGRNLHYTAQQVVNESGGVFPTQFKDLIKLKGIGNYTAAAISSFCANEPKAVVDGNVYRVLARYLGVESDINLTTTQKEFQKMADELLNNKIPGLHNQALMEFGALQCVPKNPDCGICPLVKSCFAFINNRIENLPVKSKKVKVRNRYFNYLVITDETRTLINRRGPGDIWEGLYEFPLLETEDEINTSALIATDIFQKISNRKKFTISSVSSLFKHKLTHQTIYCKFFTIKIKIKSNDKHFSSVLWEELENYPKPILIERFYQINRFKMK